MYSIHMKAIQVTFDESLLEKLDADEEVKRHGRSAVMRRAVADYLRRRRSARIREGYRRAYGAKESASDLAGWIGEGTWPED